MDTQATPDFTTLDDPEFLAEWARVRDALGDGAAWRWPPAWPP